MKRRVISIILAVLLLCAISISASADTVLNEARNSVAVLVQMVEEKGDIEPVSTGTCFFVGEQGTDPKYLITNHHVVEDYLENGQGSTITLHDMYGVYHDIKMSLRVYFSAGDYVEAYVVDYNEAQDIAVLKLDQPTTKRVPLPLQIPNDDLVGDKIFAIGYPGIADSYDQTSAWDITDSMVTQGTIGRLSTVSGSGTKWIQSSDTEVSSGSSGSPLVLENGNAIGLVSNYVADDSSQMYFAVNIEPVIDMLRSNDINVTVSDGQPAPTEAPVETPEVTPEPEPEVQPMSSNIILWAALAAAALIIVILIIVLIASKNKKKKKAAAQQEISKTTAASSARRISPVVRSMSSQHSGKKIHVANQPVTVGRAHDCSIVFQENTEGVSAHHCSISWDEKSKDFIVTDLGSTYGTYLENGQRLEAKVAYHLKAGDAFYLGDKKNVLRVEFES